MLKKNDAIKTIDRLGSNQTPFVFYCDFPGEQWRLIEHPYHTNQLLFNFNGTTNYHKKEKASFYPLKKKVIPFERFRRSFDHVLREIRFGNSFLINLTFQTPVESVLSLEQVFALSKAKYKLYVPDQFVVFSPEIFVRIKDRVIYSYPMKGTIDATIPHAKEIILDDKKETAEHVTVVDLIRNDLSKVAENVRVNKFRYVEEIDAKDKRLLQVSSEIAGDLPGDWKAHLGDLLVSLLPAGSITGAPKKKTVQIIREAETCERGFYTGICGYFDGEQLDTGIMIRFIRKDKNNWFYCSGGGITSFSRAEKEYREMIDKIYLPIG